MRGSNNKKQPRGGKKQRKGGKDQGEERLWDCGRDYAEACKGVKEMARQGKTHCCQYDKR